MRALFAIVLLLVCSAGATLAQQQSAGIDPVVLASREYEQGKLDAALAILDQALQSGPPSAKALDLRGCILMEQGKLPEAVTTLEAAHAADPTIFAPQLHRGDALLRQRKWEEARAAYTSLMRETNILMINERLRYGVLITYLGAKDDTRAKDALDRLPFPTETAAYYYGQAAWAFAHDNKRAGNKWLRTAEEIFNEKQTAWFARPLHDLGWIKNKPPLAIEAPL